MGKLVRTSAVEVGEDDDSELVVHVAQDVGVETLPGSLVLDVAMTADVMDEQAKP